MKIIVPTVLGALAISISALAQTTDPIEKPLLAAPANMKNDATVIKWKPDFTYDTLRQGKNKLVCFDRTGQPGQRPFAVECTSTANLDRVAQNLKLEAIPDKAARDAAFDKAEKDGTRVKPEFGSVWYHMSGNDQASARTHITVAVPGATSKSMGLPENPSQGGVWIMNAGTTTAHIMTPGS
ncbi:MAG: hypothetical protein JO307_16290 [Bryobacterales bacterium]|nr:hypothetical protein [Bryobacterales bacterium]MBV9398026.1 hypothetical protein [Bryobacterales bacterium]